MSGMRAGNREINIINMSLLDILCGAMGAFCFMMLALFPYWSPSGVGAKDAAAQAQQMQQELEQLKEQLRKSGGAGAANALERIEKLQQQMQQIEGENNRLRADLEEAKKKTRQLEMRNPVIIAINWSTAGHEVNVFVHTPGLKTGKGETQPPVDPLKKQGQFFFGDMAYGTIRGPGMQFWLMRDTVAGSRCDIYYKFFANNGNLQPATIFGSYIHDSKSYILPAVEMSREKTAYKVGTLIINTDYSLKFEPVPELAAAYQKQLEAARKP
ncbi:MAG: hypothetical protein ABI972_12390 [Acidobacteriota bacterium]